MLEDRRIRDIVRLLVERFGLESLWLFGSVAAGNTRSDSDLDLAGLFRAPPSTEDLLAAQAEVASLAGREADLVDLERVSPILAMQALRHGRLVHDTDPGRRVGFVAGLIGRYEDVKRFRAPIERAALRRVRGRA